MGEEELDGQAARVEVLPHGVAQPREPVNRCSHGLDEVGVDLVHVRSNRLVHEFGRIVIVGTAAIGLALDDASGDRSLHFRFEFDQLLLADAPERWLEITLLEKKVGARHRHVLTIIFLAT